MMDSTCEAALLQTIQGSLKIAGLRQLGAVPGCNEQSSHWLSDSVDEFRTSELWWCCWRNVLWNKAINFFQQLSWSWVGQNRKGLVWANIWAILETAGLCLRPLILYVLRSNKDLPEWIWGSKQADVKNNFFLIFPPNVHCEKKGCLGFKADADFSCLPGANGFALLAVVVFLLSSPFSSPPMLSLLSPFQKMCSSSNKQAEDKSILATVFFIPLQATQKDFL